MRLALSGGAYTARSLIAGAQRCLNLYAEPMPETQGEPAAWAYYPMPGLRPLTTLPQKPIRGICRTTAGAVYVVAGSGVYAMTPAWGYAQIGTITGGLTTPVGMADNGTDLVIVDGSPNGWRVTLASNAFAQIADATGSFRGGDRVDYLDTFFLFNVPGTPQFQVSDSNALTFDPLYFANKESYSDLLQTLIVVKREIYLIGTDTTEVFYNTGGADFPFSAMPGVFLDRGTPAKYSVAEVDNTAFWLARDRRGAGIVLAVAGYQATRISTYAIEYALSQYTRISDAIGFTAQIAGHVFYVLTFPTADVTWCYDLTTKCWSELAWIDNNGVEHRHRAGCAAAAYGVVAIGDWQTGNLYAWDLAAVTDAGQPIRRVRDFPHQIGDGRRVAYRQFVADMEAGQPAGKIGTVTLGAVPASSTIAQLQIPSDGLAAPTGVAVDWARGRIYLWHDTPASVRRYTTTVATQAPAVTVSLAGPVNAYGLDVDPLTGNVVVQGGDALGTNGQPVRTYDGLTLAPLGSFGAITSLPSYPTAIWAGEALVCVQAGAASYAVVKEIPGNNVAVVRLDTMAAAGFYAPVVSGALGNRALMCRGASGTGGGSVFLTWNGTVNGQSATVPLYTVQIGGAASAYNPATWPATNPAITWATIGTVAAAAIDGAWSTLKVNAIGYDAADGNVLLDVSTAAGPAVLRYIAKVSATTAAVLWVVPMTAPGTQLAAYRVSGALAVLAGGLDTVIQTGSGATSAVTLAGLTFQTYAAGDSVAGLALVSAQYNSGAGASAPAAGTPTTFTGWALIGPLYPSVTTDYEPDTAPDAYSVSLSWSDDRGHTWGNPLLQTLGGVGEYLTSLQWQRLGMARDRVFRLEWSMSAPTALQGAWITAAPVKG